jgi:hypothetical protein
MNDPTHDDSDYVLDRKITFHCGWAIERQASGLFALCPPDDKGVVSIVLSLEAAREAIDAEIAAGEVSA